MPSSEPYRVYFDTYTIKHLGLQMYSTLPPVIGELVANAWDANATEVEITIPEIPLNDCSQIVIRDNGIGMSDEDIREKYLIVGRDRREKEGTDQTPPSLNRKVMGRKGIGKFSSFGIARNLEVESASNGTISRFVMDYDEMLKSAQDRHAEFPPLPPTGTVTEGTKITLRRITKYRTRRIPLQPLRRGLARRFAVIGSSNFQVIINCSPISLEERDMKRLLGKDKDQNPYLWQFDEEIELGTGWMVSGWIGALDRTTSEADGVDRGISIMARGKLVQEPFLFNAVVGQQYALSYLVGELHAEFVDEVEDTIGTSRNVLVWDTEANEKLMEWGKRKVNKIAREWAEKRQNDNLHKLERNELYRGFKDRANEIGNERALKLADTLVRQAIGKNPTAGVDELSPIIKTSLDFLEFDTFWEITQDLVGSDVDDISKLLVLFKEWEIVEAKEMSRVTEGRIATIEKLQQLIETDALEVPTLHNFLKEFPWVIDPRWTLVADEIHYSTLLKQKFPDTELAENDRRIDFLCVRESTNLVVVEIKRPGVRASRRELEQIWNYVSFVRGHVEKATDPEMTYQNVVGYLLCGDFVKTGDVARYKDMLAKDQIYVRLYGELLGMVKRMHREFIERYDSLKQRARK